MERQNFTHFFSSMPGTILLHISTFYHFYEVSLYNGGKRDSERIKHLTSNDEPRLVSLNTQTCLLGPEGLGGH